MTVPVITPASSLQGEKVVNRKGEELGEIKEVVLDLTSNSIAYVVISFGGFMGVGNKLFGIPLSSLTMNIDENIYILDIDKERLKEAPGFDRDKWLNLSNEARTEYAACVYEHYDYKCPYTETEIIGESVHSRDRSLEEPSGRTLHELGGIKTESQTIQSMGNIKTGGGTLKSPRGRSGK
ncbi:PRC-barrel domain-containing protein [Methanolobus sp.]|uniref:PRC-barrel domain-containing protein n=1 Tax=Methanolobus sp. TaxID=1874737 RepID=UPI0025ECC41F|nr:PRC-barrel domain-containing protein [Methanolobus sp.]